MGWAVPEHGMAPVLEEPDCILRQGFGPGHKIQV